MPNKTTEEQSRTRYFLRDQLLKEAILQEIAELEFELEELEDE